MYQKLNPPSEYGRAMLGYRDGELDFIERDRANTLGVIDHGHLRNHLGKVFFTGHRQTITNSVLIGFNVITPIHLVIEVGVGGDAETLLYEDSSFTGGASIQVECRNRLSSYTADTSFYLSPTVSSVGNKICDGFIFGGTKSKSNGSNTLTSEFILKNTSYILQVNNLSGDDQPFIAHFDWYYNT